MSSGFSRGAKQNAIERGNVDFRAEIRDEGCKNRACVSSRTSQEKEVLLHMLIRLTRKRTELLPINIARGIYGLFALFLSSLMNAETSKSVSRGQPIGEEEGKKEDR